MDEHVIKGSRLDDIQHNHCRFNTRLHLKQYAAYVILNLLCLGNEELVEQIKRDAHKNDPTIEMMLIANSIDASVDEYLDSDMGYGADYWDEEEEEKGEKA